MNIRQPGKPTYNKLMVRAIFEKDYLDSVLEKISDKISDSPLYSPYAVHRIFDEWTNYGPSGEILVVDSKYERIELNIGLYLKGWTIKLKSINYNETLPDVCKKVFGDENSRTVWTQQTSLVADLTIELIDEIKKHI